MYGGQREGGGSVGVVSSGGNEKEVRALARLRRKHLSCRFPGVSPLKTNTARIRSGAFIVSGWKSAECLCANRSVDSALVAVRRRSDPRP